MSDQTLGLEHKDETHSLQSEARTSLAPSAEAILREAERAIQASNIITALRLVKKSGLPDRTKQDPDDGTELCLDSEEVDRLIDSFLEALKTCPEKTLKGLPTIMGTLPKQARSSFTSRLLIALCDVDPGIFNRYLHRSINLIMTSPCFKSISAAVRQEEIEGLEFVGSENAFLSDALLLRILRIAVLPNATLEVLLTRLRKIILCKVPRLQLDHPALTHFLSALAHQCFLTEYAYYVSEEETKEIEKLREKLEQKISDPREFEVALLLFALYRPLMSLNRFPDQLDSLGPKLSSPTSELIQATIGHYYSEQKIRASISGVDRVDDEISVSVAKQYEENPYPRWITMELPSRNSSRAILSGHYSEDELEQLPIAPTVLVAGCGTGCHSISAALRYGDHAHVVAIDLSGASLAHAVRKSREYDVTGIEYLKMDLIDLPKLGQYYDVIECVGVLHHLKEPEKGWEVLAERLRPGGFMKVGIYSAVARLPITYVRKMFGVSGSDVSADMIRQCRQRVIDGGNTYWSRFVLSFDDFYSLSGCRDLLFHVQEHLFSLSMIEKSLAELGLEFRGFALPTPVMKKYVEKYPDDVYLRNLENWKAFEKENPTTFIDMYNFWCIKRR